jgi:hypothetical protein
VGYDRAVAVLRSWLGEPVVVHLDPDGTVMRGALSERDGDDSTALFGVDTESMTGVAVALFRDGVDSVISSGDELVIRQGRVTVTVTRTP